MPEIGSKKRDGRKPLVFLFINLLCFLSASLAIPYARALEIPPEKELNDDKLWGRTFSEQAVWILTVGVAGVLIARPFDDDMRNAWLGTDKINESNGHIGDLIGTGGPGALFALAQYQFDKPNGFAHMKTLVAATVWTYALKTIAARKRPGTSENKQSFPSGHTSTSFASASALWYAYGWKVGLPLTVVATGVGLSRIAHDAHFLSDVVAGAAVGVWMGYAYAAPEKSPARGPNFNGIEGYEGPARPRTLIFPSFGNETFLLSLASEF